MPKQFNNLDQYGQDDIYTGDIQLNPDDFRIVEQSPIVHQDDGTITAYGFKLTGQGIDFTDAPNDNDSWQKLMEFVIGLEGRIGLLAGDLLNAIELKYNITYEEIEALFGRSRKSLYTYKYVCEKVPFSIRMENLTFGHYSLVAPLERENQEYWLSLASENGWSIKHLREQINPPTLPTVVQESIFDSRLRTVGDWTVNYLTEIKDLDGLEREKKLREVARLRDELDKVLKEYNWRRF